MDQEKHFDESIRRKLKDEDYTPPPFGEILPAKGGKDSNWLRGFLFGDLLLLLTFLIWSGTSYINSGSAEDRTESIATASSPDDANPNVNSSAQLNADINTKSSSSELKNNNQPNQSVSTNSVASSDTKSASKSKSSSYEKHSQGSYDLHASNQRIKSQTTYNVMPSHVYSSGMLALNEKHPDYISHSDESPEGISNPAEESKVHTDFLTPLEFETSVQQDYTLKSREYSHTPMEYRSPFSIDIMLIAEKTIGYNREIPEVSKLYLDLKPRDGGYGAGILFGYHVYKNFGISSGIETVLREYNLNYSYSSTVMVMQPDSSYKEESVILTNSRTVSETEVRIPFLATFSFTMGKKWSIEPAAGFAIKFKELKADMRGTNEIPAAILSSIEVSNGHMVTAAWMLSCQTGYQIGQNSIVFVSPYYQAESLDKNSRQYYTGRAVSGLGLKAGVKFLFNKKDDN